MKKIVVSGISGFVGSHLASSSNEKYIVKGLSRNRDLSIGIYSYDMSEDAINESDIVIHLAGMAHDLKNTLNERDYIEVNTLLTKQLYNQFLKSSSSVFIFMSSVKAVADRVIGVLEEEVDPLPETAYGKSKLAAENYILSQELPKNKKLIILRPCMIHGSGNKGNLNLLYKFVKLGIPYPLASFENSRSFLSINNLIYIIDKIIESKDIKSGVYNIADDKTLSTNRLIELMGRQRQKNVMLLRIKPSLIQCLAKLGDILHFPLNTNRLQKLTESYKVSNRKIKEALQIEKLPLTAEEGICKTLESFN